MLDLKFIRENSGLVREAIKKKRQKIDFAQFLELDQKRDALLKRKEALRATQNRFNRERDKLKPEDLAQRLADLKVVALELEKVNQELQAIEADFQPLYFSIPNLPAPEVPEGDSETDNKEIKKVGEVPKFDFEPHSAEELSEKLNLADFERGSKISGSKFYFLKGQAVILEMALVRMALDELVKTGFTPLNPPDLVTREVMYGVAHFPPETDAYKIPEDKLYLAGTAEVGLVAYRADEILEEKELPARYAGFSACFRREAGTYGRESAGLYRIHQFHKIEMVSLVKPEDSDKEHKFLLEIAEKIVQKLELPYRIVDVCGGDLGLPQKRKFDIEIWMPSRNKYGETHSCSNDTDFQARRLKIRYKTKGGKTQLVHTLNNTAIASPRILIPLLEIHQTKAGSIKIPQALAQYTGFTEIKK